MYVAYRPLSLLLRQGKHFPQRSGQHISTEWLNRSRSHRPEGGIDALQRRQVPRRYRIRSPRTRTRRRPRAKIVDSTTPRCRKVHACGPDVVACQRKGNLCFGFEEGGSRARETAGQITLTIELITRVHVRPLSLSLCCEFVAVWIQAGYPRNRVSKEGYR